MEVALTIFFHNVVTVFVLDVRALAGPRVVLDLRVLCTAEGAVDVDHEGLVFSIHVDCLAVAEVSVPQPDNVDVADEDVDDEGSVPLSHGRPADLCRRCTDRVDRDLQITVDDRVLERDHESGLDLDGELVGIVGFGAGVRDDRVSLGVGGGGCCVAPEHQESRQDGGEDGTLLCHGGRSLPR